jgi:murein DD-endopeptidase MepM/ murein hydrolase activator NlpD
MSDSKEPSRAPARSFAIWALAGLALLALVTLGVLAFSWGAPRHADEPLQTAGELLRTAGELLQTAGEPALAPALVETAPDEVLVRIRTEGEILRGRTLASVMAKKGVSPSVVHLISTELSPVFNFRYSRPGDRFEVVQDELGELLSFRYTRSPLEHYTLLPQDGGYLAERHEPAMLRKRARTAGVVSSSLYLAVQSLGERIELATDFANIFAWDVDFSRSVQSGDEFAILYERLHVQDQGELTYVRPGRILAARYSNAADDYTALYFEPVEGHGGYYRPDGSSVERQFLRAPLNYRRISSRYTLSRLHPILKVRRPHQGIDYAAQRGTPVWSVGDGKVIFRGRSGGFGKLVKVRHGNGYVSYYGHLSRFADVRVGDQVGQKQVLGFVGCTGLCTGPHLDFRFKHYGKYVNPALAGGDLDRFAKSRERLLRELDPAPIAAMTSEAL